MSFRKHISGVTPSQNVQHDDGRLDLVRQRLSTGAVYGVDPISQYGAEDVDHLPVAAGLVFQFAPNDETLSAIGPRIMVE